MRVLHLVSSQFVLYTMSVQIYQAVNDDRKPRISLTSKIVVDEGRGRVFRGMNSPKLERGNNL